MVWPRQKDTKGPNTKTNYEMDTTGEKEKRTLKENLDGCSTSSHDNEKFKTRSMEKQRGVACGFRKTATVVKNTVYIYIHIYIYIYTRICEYCFKQH